MRGRGGDDIPQPAKRGLIFARKDAIDFEARVSRVRDEQGGPTAVNRATRAETRRDVEPLESSEAVGDDAIATGHQNRRDGAVGGRVRGPSEEFECA